MAVIARMLVVELLLTTTLVACGSENDGVDRQQDLANLRKITDKNLTHCAYHGHAMRAHRYDCDQGTFIVTRGGSGGGRVDLGPPGKQRPRFASIAEALSFLRSRVGVGAVVPRNLPRGTQPLVDAVTRSRSTGEAQLRLLTPARRVLTVLYGRASFDGCEAPNLRLVQIGSERGLLSTHISNGAPFSEVIWPAESKRTTEAPFGVSGPFAPRRLLSFARSMQVQIESSDSGSSGSPGCL